MGVIMEHKSDLFSGFGRAKPGNIVTVLDGSDPTHYATTTDTAVGGGSTAATAPTSAGVMSETTAAAGGAYIERLHKAETVQLWKGIHVRLIAMFKVGHASNCEFIIGLIAKKSNFVTGAANCVVDGFGVRKSAGGTVVQGFAAKNAANSSAYGLTTAKRVKPIVAGTWHHVAVSVVMDRTTAAKGTMHVNLDGSRLAEGAFTNLSDDEPLALGYGVLGNAQNLDLRVLAVERPMWVNA